jgi:DNA-binding MarR family transcriptional regulator
MTATETAEQLGLPLSTVLDYVKAIDEAGHLNRVRHPDDGRAMRLTLNSKGVAAHNRANKHWELVRKEIEGSHQMAKSQVRAALAALDDAAIAAALSAGRVRARR